MSDNIKLIDEVLEFWFGSLDGAADFDASKNALWWNGSAADDAIIAERFGDLVKEALAGALQSWSDLARGTLALVILCDQFTRSLGRGTAEAFAGDEMAQRLCLDAIDRGFDSELRLIERGFLYMPLMHAEDRDLAKRSVAIFTELSAAISAASISGFPDSVGHAVQHAEIVTRFGRYPHRNTLLGRETTTEERQYLAAGAPTFGQKKG